VATSVERSYLMVMQVQHLCEIAMRLLPLLLSIICFSAYAEWVSIDKNDSSERFIDLDNIVKSNQFRRVWTLTDYFEIDKRYGFHSIRSYSEYDCEEPRFRVLQEEWWSKPQAAGTGITNPFTYPRPWMFLAPETLGNYQRKLAYSK
jgi:hypothetical protein